MAAQKGLAIFRGRSGLKYAKALYFDDTANNPVRWDAGTGASATSPIDWQSPETVILEDLVLSAATTQTQTMLTRNGVPTGDILLNAIHLASIVTRPVPRVGFLPGTKIGMLQLA